jgi:NADH-quinone oxidoreductase subunit K
VSLTHIGLHHYLIVSALLLGFGVLTVATRRNAVAILMGVELILNAANINFVAFSHYLGKVMGGQIFAVFVIVIAAAEAAVALSIFLRLFATAGSVEVDTADSLKN